MIQLAPASASPTLWWWSLSIFGVVLSLSVWHSLATANARDEEREARIETLVTQGAKSVSLAEKADETSGRMLILLQARLAADPDVARLGKEVAATHGAVLAIGRDSPFRITGYPASPTVPDPIDLRPDPTARFNVFRVANGALQLTDYRRLGYSGNDQIEAERTLEVYVAGEWDGTVYFYDRYNLVKQISR